MAACVKCGSEAPPQARFCPACGAPLGAASAHREQRKTVTVLFCDVTGSTALGESLDPEALRALLARYFERMKGIVETHGGTVEKFIGDAVMAVFGIPVAHEDDALRACRAAVAMQAAFPELGLAGRIGVTTGEVVTGTDERLATGDAVNVAARLQQAAAPGEVLVGEATLALASGALEADALAPLELKGKAQPVAAHRLLAVHDTPGRDHTAPFVGRRRELEALREAWRRARQEARCELVTVVGEAGVGKSRLVAEALGDAGARVVEVGCLPYGEGITYWPVTAAIKQLATLPSDADAAATLRALLGESDRATSAEQIAWAFRKLLEEAAPLIVVFDDIQWGEEAFLDLIEHVALLSAGAPLLLVCTARPEMAERRPAWPVTLRLDPLGEEDVDALIGGRLPAETRRRVAAAAAGNPLFVGEMLAIAGDAGGEISVPPTLRALLAARLDQLGGEERHVVETGAVEGEVFHRGAVQALSPEGAQITPRLAGLVRKQLVRPEPTQLPGEDGFRFRHLLLRDAAYDGLPKSARAELHERLARWLLRHAERLPELEELVGHHLASAYGYRAELGGAESVRALADEAAAHLAVAGRRAHERRDFHAAARLLRRARPLAGDGSAAGRRIGLDLGQVLWGAGAFAEARELLQAVETAADAAGDAVAVAHARLGLADIAQQVDPEGAADERRRAADAAMPVFEAAGDDLGIAAAWAARAAPDHMRARFEPYREAHERALVHLRRAGDRIELGRTLSAVAHAVAVGPTPVAEGLERIDAILAELPEDRLLRARALVRRGFLLALAGEGDAAIAAEEQSHAILAELGSDFALGSHGLMAGSLERFLGNFERSEQVLRRADAVFARVGERSVRSTVVADLALALHAQGRLEEAEQSALLALELGSTDDTGTSCPAETVLALVGAARGETGAVERAARAVALAEETDMLWMQGEAWEAYARALRALGRDEEAADAMREAALRFEAKGAALSRRPAPLRARRP